MNEEISSLFRSFKKIMESTMYHQITDYLTRNNIITCLRGFRPDNSIEMASNEFNLPMKVLTKINILQKLSFMTLTSFNSIIERNLSAEIS